MAYTLWAQDIFTKGELSPFMYARCSVNEYQNGLKTAQNVLTYPTGAAGKRFGTLYQATLTLASANQLYFQTFQYLNECVYQLVITVGNIYIYLEGILVATVSNSFTQNQISNLSSTVITNIFRMAAQGMQPQDLTRTANGSGTGIDVVSFTSTTITTTTPAFLANTVLPFQFQISGGTGIQTSPQISAGVTYFAAGITTTTAAIFLRAQDAKAFLQNQSITTSAITISSLGTGTTKALVLNTWTLANTFFKNLPVYDFNGQTISYDAITFTVAAQSGATQAVTLSAPYAPLTSAYIGGAFIAGGGSGRITAVADTSHFTIAVQTVIPTGVIQGSQVFLAEPAWSTTRGYPQVCSSYQSRALFANTSSLPNGFWASVVNDYADFGDLTTDDDDAISWYPTSDNMNFIKFIVPYRSITVHTNTGIYSSPLSDVSAITPRNFTLQLQDSTPATVLQPQAIDNQILVLSGNDAHQMLWDGINNAYTSDIVSVINEQTIRNPVDETAFVDLTRAGSRFVFIVNENGSMAIFQTLLSQNVSGFTPHVMQQSYGHSPIRQVGSSSDGRCWFVVEREIASALSPIAISFDSIPTTSVRANASNFLLTSPTAIQFTTSGELPVSTPQIVTGKFFWAVGIDANHFAVYTTQADAKAGTNPISFTGTGVSSYVTPWPLTTIFTLEELTFNTFLDCAIFYSGSPSSTITTGALFNAQMLKWLAMVLDLVHQQKIM